jgi:hypothetical protein
MASDSAPSAAAASAHCSTPGQPNWDLRPTIAPPQNPRGQKTHYLKGGVGSGLYGVACPSTSTCTAVGPYYNTSDVEVRMAEARNGTA